MKGPATVVLWFSSSKTRVEVELPLWLCCEVIRLLREMKDFVLGLN
jgi:hypothetical protein